MYDSQEKQRVRAAQKTHGGCHATQKWILEAYIVALLAVFPFFNTDKYFSILSDRAMFFKNITMVMVAALLAEWVMRNAFNIRQKDVRLSAGSLDERIPAAYKEPGIHISWYCNIPLEYVFLSAFLIISALSTLLSEHIAKAWSGEAGRLQGMSMWLAYGAAFYCTDCYFRPKKPHLFLLLICGAAAALWGISDYMGPGLSWWLADVKETQKHMFTSCIGNINTYTAFITICFSLAGAYIVYADNLARQWQAVLPLLFFLFSVALATGRSDNAVIGIVVFFFVLPCGIGDTRQLCRHLWLVAAFAMAFIMAGILSAYTMNPYMEGQEGILLRAVGGRRASGFAAFIGIAAAAISICGTRHERRPLHRFRRAWAAFLAACCIGSVLVFLHANFLARPGQYGAAEAYLKFNDSWGTHRGLCWRLAFESYLKFPPIKKLIGSGPDTFGIIMKQEHCQTMIRECGQVFDSPHNELIQYLFCTGILGAVCYYVFLAACFFKGMRGDTIGKTAALAMLVYTAVSFVNISVPITQPYLVILAAWCSGAYQQGKCKKMSIKQ